jgi:hypothetical protein
MTVNGDGESVLKAAAAVLWGLMSQFQCVSPRNEQKLSIKMTTNRRHIYFSNFQINKTTAR